MKTMTNLEKFGLAAALIIACTFFYMKYMYDPQTKVLKTTLEKRNKIVKELNLVKDIPPLFQVEKTIEKNKKILEEVRRESGNLSVKTGNPDEITELLSQINRIIESNRLDVNLIVPKEGIDGRFFRWAPFEMDLSGSFSSFMAFMKEIKDLNDAVEIRNVVLENSEKKQTAINIKFILKI
jgi:Tfp pilus assembly protein PilO